MKIQFLGTGSVSSLSNSASLFIDDDILIDCGNGIYKALLKAKIDIKKIRYILITHLHGDHVFDIPFLLYGLSKKNPKQKISFIGNRFLKKKILRLMKEAFPMSWWHLYYSLDINYIRNEKLNHYYIRNGIYIDSFNVHHGNFPSCFGYLINHKVAITGDCSYDEKIQEISKKASYLICDSTMRIGNSSHMGVDNIKEIAMVPQLKIYTTHMGVLSKSILQKTYFPYHNVFVASDYEIIYI